jgi:hypothetical protein
LDGGQVCVCAGYEGVAGVWECDGLGENEGEASGFVLCNFKSISSVNEMRGNSKKTLTPERFVVAERRLMGATVGAVGRAKWYGRDIRLPVRDAVDSRFAERDVDENLDLRRDVPRSVGLWNVMVLYGLLEGDEVPVEVGSLGRRDLDNWGLISVLLELAAVSSSDIMSIVELALLKSVGVLVELLEPHFSSGFVSSVVTWRKWDVALSSIVDVLPEDAAEELAGVVKFIKFARGSLASDSDNSLRVLRTA